MRCMIELALSLFPLELPAPLGRKVFVEGFALKAALASAGTSAYMQGEAQKGYRTSRQ